MSLTKTHTGFAIAIAWPETYCKQPGSWYDGITAKMGVNKNNYYMAGHAALVLVEKSTGNCQYFDFGRYHSPFQHGRVRSVLTDDDLRVNTKAIFSKDKTEITNFKEILTELQTNPSCHGEGELKASYCPVNFQSAFKKANQMQNDSPMPYGPFFQGGSNCSRFVNSAIMAGKPPFKYIIYLKHLIFITPTPMNNVNALDHKIILPVILDYTPFEPVKILSVEQIRSTLFQPERDNKIPGNAQWLAGEGAGSWFSFEGKDGNLQITRYSPGGTVECKGEYWSEHKNINTKRIKITYPSNCNKVHIIDSDKIIVFNRLDKN